MELGILHNSPPSTKRGCRAGRLHRLWHGLPPAPWPCTRSQHHSVPLRNLHPLMVPPFLQPHPDLQSAVGNTPLSSKHPAQLPTTDCLLSIISPMGGQPSDAPALSPPSPLQQGGQSSNAPALSPPSPLPQGGQPIALALSPPSPPPQGGQPSDAPGLSPSSSILLLCPSDSTLNICHLHSQSAVKTGTQQRTGVVRKITMTVIALQKVKMLEPSSRETAVLINADDQSAHDNVKSDHDSLHSAKETTPSTVINRNDQVTSSPNSEASNEACDAAARSSEATASINAAMDDITVNACTSSKNRDGNSSLKNTSVDYVNDRAGVEIILPDSPLQPQDCACT
ncbi:hypothetical protein ACOMHN_014839 [Nucella lapillus]